MSSYYYVQDPGSEYGFTPIPEDEYIQVIYRIAKKHGLNITDKMILKDLENLNNKSRHTR